MKIPYPKIRKTLNLMLNCRYYHTVSGKEKKKITEHIGNIVEPQKSKTQLAVSVNQYFSEVNCLFRITHLKHLEELP